MVLAIVREAVPWPISQMRMLRLRVPRGAVESLLPSSLGKDRWTMGVFPGEHEHRLCKSFSVPERVSHWKLNLKPKAPGASVWKGILWGRW